MDTAHKRASAVCVGRAYLKLVIPASGVSAADRAVMNNMYSGFYSDSVTAVDKPVYPLVLDIENDYRNLTL